MAATLSDSVCTFIQRNVRCKNLATTSRNGKDMCLTHDMRLARKAVAQRKKRSFETMSKVAFEGNSGLQEETVNTTSTSIEASTSASKEVSTKHSTTDKNIRSKTTSFNADGSIQSIKCDVINETEVSIEEKYKVVIAHGFTMTEVDKFSRINRKLTSPDPLKTFATHRPLMDDCEDRVVDEREMVLVDLRLQEIAEMLDFESIEEMEKADFDDVFYPAFSNWQRFDAAMKKITVDAYTPFCVFYVHACGNVLVGQCGDHRLVSAGRAAYIIEGNLAICISDSEIEKHGIQRAAQSCIHLVSPEVGAEHFLRNLARGILYDYTSSASRAAMIDIERKRLAKLNAPFEENPDFDGSEPSIEEEAKRKLANMISYYISRRAEHACAESKPARPLPKMPYFITDSITRRRQHIETPIDEIEFDWSFRINGIPDIIGGAERPAYLQTKLSARSAALFQFHEMKKAVDEHLEIFQEKGQNVTSLRAHKAFGRFLEMAT